VKPLPKDQHREERSIRRQLVEVRGINNATCRDYCQVGVKKFFERCEGTTTVMLQLSVCSASLRKLREIIINNKIIMSPTELKMQPTIHFQS
jgi:hypothetical protein